MRIFPQPLRASVPRVSPEEICPPRAAGHAAPRGAPRGARFALGAGGLAREAAVPLPVRHRGAAAPTVPSQQRYGLSTSSRPTKPRRVRRAGSASRRPWTVPGPRSGLLPFLVDWPPRESDMRGRNRTINRPKTLR